MKSLKKIFFCWKHLNVSLELHCGSLVPTKKVVRNPVPINPGRKNGSTLPAPFHMTKEGTQADTEKKPCWNLLNKVVSEIFRLLPPPRFVFFFSPYLYSSLYCVWMFSFYLIFRSLKWQAKKCLKWKTLSRPTCIIIIIVIMCITTHRALAYFLSTAIYFCNMISFLLIHDP